MLFFCEPIFVGLLMCMHHCLLLVSVVSLFLCLRPWELQGLLSSVHLVSRYSSCRDYVEPMFWLFSFLIITV